MKIVANEVPTVSMMTESAVKNQSEDTVASIDMNIEALNRKARSGSTIVKSR